jgi:hypothetical protein
MIPNDYRMITSSILLATLIALLGGPTWLSAQQPAEAPPSLHPLAHAQTVLVEGVALTERGLQDPAPLIQTVAEQLRRVGLTIVSQADQPHDAVVRVKCEERQTWTGPSKYRSTSPSPTTRLWKGPACHLSYRYGQDRPNWSWEVRTAFEDAREAAKAAGATDVGAFAMSALNTQLQQNEFPLFLAAEWGQTDRLLEVYRHSTDQIDRQRTILQLLGDLPSPQSLAVLQEALSHPALASTALLALGQQGEAGIPALSSFLESATDPEQRLAAIQGLGAIATHTKTPALFTQFMALLEAEDPRVQTEAVKGLGNLGDRRAIEPLEKLNLKAWTNASTHPDVQALREMLSWSLWQLNPDAHTGG